MKWQKVIIGSVAAVVAVGIVVGILVGVLSKKADTEHEKITVNEDVDDSEKHGDRDEDTEDADQKSNDEYFIFEDRDEGTTLVGLTDLGKEQETLVIPADVLISCTLKIQ